MFIIIQILVICDWLASCTASNELIVLAVTRSKVDSYSYLKKKNGFMVVVELASCRGIVWAVSSTLYINVLGTS